MCTKVRQKLCRSSRASSRPTSLWSDKCRRLAAIWSCRMSSSGSYSAREGRNPRKKWALILHSCSVLCLGFLSYTEVVKQILFAKASLLIKANKYRMWLLSRILRRCWALDSKKCISLKSNKVFSLQLAETKIGRRCTQRLNRQRQETNLNLFWTVILGWASVVQTLWRTITSLTMTRVRSIPKMKKQFRTYAHSSTNLIATKSLLELASHDKAFNLLLLHL